MFVVCLVGVWQRNFEPVVCVCVRHDGLGTTVVPSPSYPSWYLLLFLRNSDYANALYVTS